MPSMYGRLRRISESTSSTVIHRILGEAEWVQVFRQVSPPTQAAVPAGAREYVVKDGEDLYSIGLAIGAKPYQIRLLNEGRNLEGLQPGDRIFVPAE